MIELTLILLSMTADATMLAPQTVYAGGAVSGSPVTLSRGDAAITKTDCSALCQTIWDLTTVQARDPFEVAKTSTEIENGDACDCLTHGPKLRNDGS